MGQNISVSSASSTRKTMAGLAVVVIGCGLLVILRDPILLLPNALVAAATVVAGAVPTIRYIAMTPEQRPMIPGLELIGVFYAAFFGLPVFFLHVLRFGHSNSIVTYNRIELAQLNFDAQSAVFISLLLFYIGWLSIENSAWGRHRRLRFPPPPSRNHSILALSGLAIVNVGYELIPFIRTLPSVGQFAGPAGFISMIGFLLLYLKSKKPSPWLILVIGVYAPVWTYNSFQSAFLTQLVLMFIMLAVTYIWVRKSIPWLSIIAVIGMTIFAYPTLSKFRVYMWQHHSISSVAQTIENFSRAIKFTYVIPHQRLIWQGAVQRTALIVPFSHVVDVTPSKIEFLQGATYRPLLTSYIPRLFWKSKPTEQLGNEFGHRYSLMHYTDHRSSLNVPWVTELYANFGFTGLFIGMTLFGAGLAMFRRFLTGMDRTEIGSAVAIAVLVPLAFHESNFSLMVGSILPLLICLWIYFRVVFLLPIPAKSDETD